MKSIKEINEKIKKGDAVVVTAEEVIDLVAKKGTARVAEEVDVVTTGTFGPMCSSGAYFNIGHSKPRIKIGGGTCTLNDVPAYCGLAAVDIFLGATAVPEDDPRNKVYPGEFAYGGAHVIHELVSGNSVRLEAHAYGTDCYPRKHLKTALALRDLNEAVLFNVRNCYQNYNVAVNTSDKPLYTYMGMLKPGLGNANYCSAGQLSPLLKDPFLKTIGVGTRIFLGGSTGYVAWHGTQHNPMVPRAPSGAPVAPAATLAVIGDLKAMRPEYLVASSMLGYGVTLVVGIGVPLPVLDEEVVRYAALQDKDIMTKVVDYSRSYPQMTGEVLGETNYAELVSGTISVAGKKVPTGNLSSYYKANQICQELKAWIKKGLFLLSEPVMPLPQESSGYTTRPLNERPFTNGLSG